MILLISPKNIYATDRLVAEAGLIGLPIVAVDSRELGFVDLSQFDLLYVRSFDMAKMEVIKALAREFLAKGKKVIGNVLDDSLGKLNTYQLLKQHSLPIPTLYPRYKITYPCVIKTSHGMGSREVFFAANEPEAQSIITPLLGKEWLVQEFVDADYEWKIMTVGHKATPIALRFAIDKKTMRPNPGQYDIVETTHIRHKYLVYIAEQAAKITNRELAKIDILQKGNQFYILEVNRWPGLQSFEDFSRYNVAGDFAAYLKHILDLQKVPIL